MQNMGPKKKLIISALVVVGLVAVIAISVNARRKDLIPVQTGHVKRVAQLISKVNAPGEIQPREFVELQAEISGVITRLYVKEGDFVSKGDLLLRIDPTQTEAETRAQQAVLAATVIDAANQKAQISLQKTNVAREEANVLVAEAELRRARQALDLSGNNFNRKQALFEENLISRDLYEAAKNDRVAAESAVDSAEARLQQAKAQLAVSKMVLAQNKNSYQSALSRVKQNRAVLARVQDSLSKTIIRSPLSGVITQLNVEVGERAVPGTLNNPAATIMVIANLSVIEAEIEVDETDIVNVRLGQQAVVNVDALPDRPLRGKVTEIGNSAIQKPGQSQEAKDFKVAVRLEDPPSSLRPGLSCTADITTAIRDNVLTIPIQALAVREFEVDVEGNPIRPDPKNREEDKGDLDRKTKRDRKEFEGVFVVVKKKAHFVPISTGITGETEVEVASGLEESALIVTGSYKALRTLKDGDPVKVVNRERG
ncbi:MAG: HlyD family secretion protein [Acidobacteriota bacterium]